MTSPPVTIGQTDSVRGCRCPLNRSSSHQIGNGQENTTRAPVEGADGADIIMDELGRSREPHLPHSIYPTYD